MSWNQPKWGTKPTVRRASRGRGLLRVAVALLCLVAAVIVYLVWTGGEDARNDEASPPQGIRLAAVRPHTAKDRRTKANPTVSDRPREALPPHVPAAPEKRLYRGVEVVSASCKTNLDGAVVERLRLADGRFVKAVRLPEPVFRRPSDQLIALALSSEPGVAVPPLPIGPDAERSFRDSLSEPIVVLDSDTPEVRELKARVMEARAQIEEAIRNGGSFREALEEHVRASGRMADRRAEVARMAQEVRAEGGETEAKVFTERANVLLEADGVPPVSVPGQGRPRRGNKPGKDQ